MWPPPNQNMFLPVYSCELFLLALANLWHPQSHQPDIVNREYRIKLLSVNSTFDCLYKSRFKCLLFLFFPMAFQMYNTTIEHSNQVQTHLYYICFIWYSVIQKARILILKLWKISPHPSGGPPVPQMSFCFRAGNNSSISTLLSLHFCFT